MKPNYYSKAFIDFNYFLPNKIYFTNQLIKLNYTSTLFYYYFPTIGAITKNLIKLHYIK